MRVRKTGLGVTLIFAALSAMSTRCVSANRELFAQPAGPAPAANAGGGAANDPHRASEPRHLACDRGDMRGCFDLGVCYETGACGLAQDAKRAGELYKQACYGGNAKGCASLGDCCANGACGLAKNARRAGELFKLACAGGDADACRKIRK
jgi:TPR repeat protein